MSSRYTFTSKKSIRKVFGELLDSIEIPNILEIQLNSYKSFLQKDVPFEERDDVGLQAVLKSLFPIVSYSGNAALEYVDYYLGESDFSVRECLVRGITYAAPLKNKVASYYL